jgi:hypothetical protein
MSIVIIGGHDRMICQYRTICKKYGCKAKIYTQAAANLDCLIGNPDLIVLFTNPVSHEMVKIAKKAAAQKAIDLVQSHNGSANALKSILDNCCV